MPKSIFNSNTHGALCFYVLIAKSIEYSNALCDIIKKQIRPCNSYLPKKQLSTAMSAGNCIIVKFNNYIIGGLGFNIITLIILINLTYSKKILIKKATP